jgi:hypothetical protein
MYFMLVPIARNLYAGHQDKPCWYFQFRQVGYAIMISNREMRQLVLRCPLQQELWRMVAIRKMAVAMKVDLHLAMFL